MAARPMMVQRPLMPAKPASMFSAIHFSACRHSCTNISVHITGFARGNGAPPGSKPTSSRVILNVTITLAQPSPREGPKHALSEPALDICRHLTQQII